MNQSKKSILFIFICLLLTVGSFGVKYYSNYVKKHYGELYLEFVKIADSYEVGSNLEAISFIKETNAENVKYPKIDTDEPGIKNYFYIISDKIGNTREFALTLNITDPIFPIIELKEKEVQVEEGSAIDLTSFILRSYDPIDGNLSYEIQSPDDYESIGSHEIVYKCKDNNGNLTETTLTLVVKEKPKKEVDMAPVQNGSQNQTNVSEPKQEQAPQPVNPSPQNKYYMFSDGYDMQSAPQACNQDLVNAQSAGHGANCIQVNGNDGWPIGMQLLIK